jgi:hypothetical protein
VKLARFAFSVLTLVGGCKGGTAIDPLDAAPSPQAKAEPAPLANVPPTAGGTPSTSGVADGGVTPEPLRSDRPLPADSAKEVAHESSGKEPARDTRDLAGYWMQAVVRSGEGPGPLRAPETNVQAIESTRRKTEAHIAIEASASRARFVLSGGFVLPQGTELRGRLDRYGHVLLWPGEDSYRIVEPGALRALFGERRLDVAPMSQANAVPKGDGARRLNMRTRRVDVWTRAAEATVELGTVRESGDAGTLVCRLLLDLMSAPPSTSVCATDEVPLHAELRWTTRGALVFDVTSVARKGDIPAQDLAVPPASAVFTASPPTLATADTLLQRGELVAMRTAPVDVPPASARDAQAPPGDVGLLLVNSTDELRIAWIDGVPAAWVSAGGRLLLPWLLRGRYVLQWRTFLGDAWDPPETVVVPGTNATGNGPNP